MERRHKVKKNNQRIVSLLITLMLLVSAVVGCGQKTSEQAEGDKVSSGNVIITETGEVIEIEGPEEVEQQPVQTKEPALATSTPEIIVPETPIQEPEIAIEESTEPEKVDYDDNKLQLVFLGDSIFDGNRDGTGVPALTAQQCDANFYNLAIGGTSATLEADESMESEKWTSTGLCGVVYAMAGKIPTDIFEGKTAKAILDDPNADFTKTDYFIVEYGLNDYFRGVARDGGDHPGDAHYYVGALRFAVSNLRQIAPDATIVLCSPHYCRFFDETGWMIGDGNVVDNGNGTLYDYKGTCEYVTNEMGTLFLNTYDNLGINGYTAEDYLEDGVHLTLAGRELYADALSRLILNYEETKNN